MRRMIFAVAVLLVVDQVRAGTIFNDGGTHTVNGPSADITVSNATTLNVQSGAVIVGADGTSTAGPASGIFATGVGTTVNVSGGSITGGNTSPSFLFGGYGIDVENGASLTVTSGQITAGNSPLGHALLVQDVTFSTAPISVSISGGDFLGVFALTYATHGGSVAISGGTFSFNNTPGGTGFGPEIIFSSAIPGTATISGGTFNAFPLFSLELTNSISTIRGGVFNGPAWVNSSSALSTSTVTGGQFNGGLRLELSFGATTTFLGSGLHYSNGVLAGTLANGDSINTLLSFGSQDRITVSGTPTDLVFTGGVPTPEPASLAMMSLGLAAVAVKAWRHRRPA